MQIDMRRFDPSLNMNRFYSVELTKDLFEQHGVHRQWGRFGTWGRHRHDWYATKTEAESALSDLIKQKLARGYLPTQTHSLHWVSDAGFADAIANYLRAEREAVEEEIEILTEYGPFKRVEIEEQE